MRRIMRAFKLNEISGVDRPAQAHARAAIMKRDAPELRAIGKDNALLKKLGLLKNFGINKAALSESIKSIVDDPEADDKAALVDETIKQFTEAVADDLEKTLAVQITVEPSDEDKMSAALAKALGLADSASVEDIIAAVAAKDSALAKAKSDADAVVKAAHDAEIAKAVAEKDALAKRLEVLESERELAKFAKVAEEIGVPVSKAEVLMKAYKGDATPIAGSTLSAVDEVFAMLKAAHAALASSDLLKEYGSTNALPSDETSAIEAKAAELRKADPSLTREQAFTRAYTDPANRDLAKAERRKNRPSAA